MLNVDTYIECLRTLIRQYPFWCMPQFLLLNNTMNQCHDIKYDSEVSDDVKDWFYIELF